MPEPAAKDKASVECVPAPVPELDVVQLVMLLSYVPLVISSVGNRIKLSQSIVLAAVGAVYSGIPAISADVPEAIR